MFDKKNCISIYLSVYLNIRSILFAECNMIIINQVKRGRERCVEMKQD